MTNTFLPRVSHIDITSRCNLNCIHCRLENKDDFSNKELTFEEIIEIINKLKEFESVEWISIGGGEPLLRKDLYDIIKYSKENGFKILLVTNGILVDEKVIENLQNSGLNRVQVSIDGFEKKTHELIRGKNTFDKTLNSIRLFLNSKIETTIRCVINKLNYTEVEDLIKFFAKEGVPSISIRRFVPSGNSIPNFKELYLDSNIYHDILKKSFLLGKSLKVKIASGDPLALVVQKELGLIKSENFLGGCTIGITYLYIDPFGKIKPCPMLNLILGDAKKDSLKLIWENSEIYKNSRKRFVSGKCFNCSDKFICGGCRANSLYLNKSLWGEDPLCWKNELFSKTN